jgi:hypothetical protein
MSPKPASIVKNDAFAQVVDHAGAFDHYDHKNTARDGAIAGGLVLMAAGPASAYVACNNGGECRYSDSQYAAPA